MTTNDERWQAAIRDAKAGIAAAKDDPTHRTAWQTVRAAIAEAIDTVKAASETQDAQGVDDRDTEGL